MACSAARNVNVGAGSNPATLFYSQVGRNPHGAQSFINFVSLSVGFRPPNVIAVLFLILLVLSLERLRGECQWTEEISISIQKVGHFLVRSV